MNFKLSFQSKDFDSVLMPVADDTLSLMFQLKIVLERVEPDMKLNFSKIICDGQGNLLNTIDYTHHQIDFWTGAEWNEFVNDFHKSAVIYWDDQFDLVPIKPWFKRPAGLVPAKVNCRLSVEILSDPLQRHHMRFKVFKPKKTSKMIRAHVYSGIRPRQGILDQSNAKTDWFRWFPPTIRPAAVVTQIKGKPHAVDFVRNSIAHELGHVFGYEHVHGPGNETEKYGTANVYDADSIMGMGTNVRPELGEAWIKRLDEHLMMENPQEKKPWFGVYIKRPHIDGFWDNGEVVHVGGDLWVFKNIFGQ